MTNTEIQTKLPLQYSYTTPRLLLRPYTLHDYAVWTETHGDLPTTDNPWASQALPADKRTRKTFRHHLKTWQKDWENDHFYHFAAFDQKSHQLIGQISLMDISRENFQNAYVGYTVHAPFWQQGYGKEILRGGMDIAFRYLKLHRVEAGIEPDNTASIRLAESVGMRLEGLSKNRLYFKGQWRDMLIYAVTVEDIDRDASI